MHPEVQENAPGECPKCGIDLEPESPWVARDSEEYHFMAKRFWIALAFALPVFVRAMSLSSVSVISNALRLRKQEI